MSVKLTYFDARGRGETSRLVLHAAKKQFEDNRVQKPDWPKLKPTMPFGSLPVLEVGGNQYGQGMAVATYLAKENGLYGSSNLEQLQIDQIHQLREDLIVQEIKTHYESDADKKPEAVKNMEENVYPRYLGYFNKLIADNKAKNKSDYAVGKKLSLADIVIYEGTQTVSQKHPAMLDKYPEVKALRARVEQEDGLKQYLAKRKKTDF